MTGALVLSTFIILGSSASAQLEGNREPAVERTCFDPAETLTGDGLRCVKSGPPPTSGPGGDECEEGYNNVDGSCISIVEAGWLCDGEAVTMNMQSGASGIGGAGRDVILGTDGADLIKSGGGDDLVCALDGDDEVRGGDGNDVIFGMGGNDKLIGLDGDDNLYGGSGDDKLNGINDADRMFGGDGNDTLGGGAGDDYALGGDGNDILYGGTGFDDLFGEAGDDTLRGNADDDNLDGGDDIDDCDGHGGTNTVVNCELP